MIYREYGRTGVKVSALGFGGMRFENVKDVDACAALVKACYDAGITYFDTAIGYDHSEEVMGVAFKDMLATRGQRPFCVATKTFGETADDIRRDCETSLGRLNVGAIDFYHMWCLIRPEEYAGRKLKGALKAFERLKEEGLVRHVCVSTHMNGGEIAEMLADYPFEGILLGCSVLNSAYREAGIAAAAARGMGVVVMNPLGGGVIPQQAARFDFVRTRPDETVVEGALRFLFNDPRITVTLVGMANRRELDEAVRAVEGFRPLPEGAVARIRGHVGRALNELCTACRYCDKCPEGIPVPELMDAYNQYLLTGKKEAMLNRLNWHWDILYGGHHLERCTECGLCVKSCTQKLPILGRMAELRAEIEALLKREAEAEARKTATE